MWHVLRCDLTCISITWHDMKCDKTVTVTWHDSLELYHLKFFFLKLIFVFEVISLYSSNCIFLNFRTIWRPLCCDYKTTNPLKKETKKIDGGELFFSFTRPGDSYWVLNQVSELTSQKDPVIFMTTYFKLAHPHVGCSSS